MYHKTPSLRSHRFLSLTAFTAQTNAKSRLTAASLFLAATPTRFRSQAKVLLTFVVLSFGILETAALSAHVERAIKILRRLCFDID